MRAAAILIQKNWRAHAGRRNYLRMRTGYMRMQALIRSRILSHKFRHLRGHVVRLQARCRGYLVRRSVQIIHSIPLEKGRYRYPMSSLNERTFALEIRKKNIWTLSAEWWGLKSSKLVFSLQYDLNILLRKQFFGLEKQAPTVLSNKKTHHIYLQLIVTSQSSHTVSPV